MKYKAVLLVKRPETAITADIFNVVTLETPLLKEGDILIKQTHMSLDPAMRGWMNADRGSYIPPVELGEIMRSSGVGDVVESLNENFPKGTRVSGMFGWTEYSVSQGQGLQPLPKGIEPEAVLCVLALPGVTAYQGLMNIGKPKAGETLLVSGAAGSVGTIVGQIAKAEGLRVIGSAGSEEKCRWLKDELGFDAAVNYKSNRLFKDLLKAAPDGIDIFFENTGGPIQQAAFNLMNAHGRIVVCGVISEYNSDKPSPGPSWVNIVRKRLRIQGFTMPDYWDKFPELSNNVATYLLQGKIKYRAHVLEGLESAIDGINLLFTGGNMGKLMVKL
ncbi:MAG: NADP-dependent oxidoreductase [Proteobacteria bacterium]|nr:NADP-dependent oxidoreductase [Pseudomonadota bacterium]